MLRSIINLTHSHPWTSLLVLAFVALAIQIVIDAAMGDTAEYFNAARVFVAWREVFAGRDPLGVSFLAGQEKLGGFALPIGTVILLVQPAIYGGLIFLAVRLVGRFLE